MVHAHYTGEQVIYGQNDLTDRELTNLMAGRIFNPLAHRVLTHADVGTDKILWEYGLLVVRQQLHALLTLETGSNTEAGDTLSLYIDASPDDGRNWYNIVRFTTITGAFADGRQFLVVTRTEPSSADSYIEVTGDLAAAAAPRHFIGNRVRVRATTADADGDAVWTVSLSMLFH